MTESTAKCVMTESITKCNMTESTTKCDMTESTTKFLGTFFIHFFNQDVIKLGQYLVLLQLLTNNCTYTNAT